MLVIGLDIGGANLKAATSDGVAVDLPFPLWKHPEQLTDKLRECLDQLPPADAFAVTMTGELVDGFSSKTAGVRSIVKAASDVAMDRPCWFWQTGGEFVGALDALELTRLVAAANWHALATFCGRMIPEGDALMIDIGSTTTDIIPLSSGRVITSGLTDPERLRHQELIYTGGTRTPLCAVCSEVDFGGETYGVAAEWFATTRDIYLILGSEPEVPLNLETADGRPATKEHARMRIARMLCADPDELGDIDQLAQAFADIQQARIRRAIVHHLEELPNCNHVLISGSGAHIALNILDAHTQFQGLTITRLDTAFTRHVSRSACAYAVARLAVEAFDGAWA